MRTEATEAERPHPFRYTHIELSWAELIDTHERFELSYPAYFFWKRSRNIGKLALNSSSPSLDPSWPGFQLADSTCADVRVLSLPIELLAVVVLPAESAPLGLQSAPSSPPRRQ